MHEPIVFIKPIWVVILYVSTLILGGFGNLIIAPNYIFLGVIISLGAVAFQMYWAVSVYHYLSDHVGQKNRNPVPKVIYYAGIIGYFVLILAIISAAFKSISDVNNMHAYALVSGLIIGNLSALTLVGIAAFKIENVEKGPKANAMNYLGSFLQVFYFPIGIWFLHSRLKKLTSKS